MEGSKRPPDFNLEISADLTCVKDMIKGILHTIFFHRVFTAARPATRDVLNLTLPAVDDVELETLIDQRASALVRHIDSVAPAAQQGFQNEPQAKHASNRAQLAVQLFEKRRRKTYFFGKGDEEVCWEQWTLDVTLTRPITSADAEKMRGVMEKSLRKAAMKIITIAGEEKEHIPPITTSDTNPFPYQILLNPKDQSWKMGIF